MDEKWRPAAASPRATARGQPETCTRDTVTNTPETTTTFSLAVNVKHKANISHYEYSHWISSNSALLLNVL